MKLADVKEYIGMYGKGKEDLEKLVALEAEYKAIFRLWIVLRPLRTSGGTLALVERNYAIVDEILSIDYGFPTQHRLIASLKQHARNKSDLSSLKARFEEVKKKAILPSEFCLRCVKCGKAYFTKLSTSEDIPEAYIPWLQDGIFVDQVMKFSGVVPSVCPECLPTTEKLPLPEWREV